MLSNDLKARVLAWEYNNEMSQVYREKIIGILRQRTGGRSEMGGFFIYGCKASHLQKASGMKRMGMF